MRKRIFTGEWYQKDERQYYRRLWRNQHLTTTARTPEDMIMQLRDAAATLEEMQAVGLRFDMGGAADDYVDIWTTDPRLAERYNLDLDDPDELEDEDDEEEEEEDEDEGSFHEEGDDPDEDDEDEFEDED